MHATYWMLNGRRPIQMHFVWPGCDVFIRNRSGKVKSRYKLNNWHLMPFKFRCNSLMLNHMIADQLEKVLDGCNWCRASNDYEPLSSAHLWRLLDSVKVTSVGIVVGMRQKDERMDCSCTGIDYFHNIKWLNSISIDKQSFTSIGTNRWLHCEFIANAPPRMAVSIGYDGIEHTTHHAWTRCRLSNILWMDAIDGSVWFR